MNELIRYEDPGMDTMRLGEVLAKSGYFQDARDAAQAVVKVLAGRELGIGPVASMTGIYLVKGRVTLSANLMAAQIKRSGKYDYRVTKMDDKGCTVEFFQGGQPIGISSFDEADARAAGLLGGDNWKKFPRNMYFSRAMSNGAKWFCPDVFSGPVYTPDELQGGASYVDTTTGEIVDAAPQNSTPPATEKQKNYIVGLQDKLGWDTTQLAGLAAQHNIDLATMYASEASTLIEVMNALIETRGKAPTRPLVVRLRELVADCKRAGVEVPELPKPRDMTDDQLMSAIGDLEKKYDQARAAVEIDELFPQ